MIKKQIVDACEVIDNIINVDIRIRGVIKHLYEYARKKSKLPLVLNAAESLMKKVEKGNVVVIGSGTVLNPTYLGIGEMDGPPGATVLARTIGIGLGAIPLVIQESSQVEKQSSLMRNIGFTVTSLENAKKVIEIGRGPHMSKGFTTGRLMSVVDSFPENDKLARKAAKEFISEVHPAAVITVEVRDSNEKGVYHDGGGGWDASEGTARINYLIDEARDNGILTIGIGDYGNEIGCALVKEAVKKFVPWGAKCRCPCGGGVAAATETDLLVTAAVSNWAAGGISTALGLMLGNREIIHSGRLEAAVVKSAANAGFNDLWRILPSVDGLPLEVHVQIAELVRAVGENALKRLEISDT